MTPSRREFLHAAGASAGLTLVAPFTWAADEEQARKAAPRVRRDIADPKAKPDVDTLSRAVGMMKDMPASKCESWTAWSKIHGTVGGNFNKCQHNNWYIWPWHRMYVYFFEQIVISLTGVTGFALPYWDWTRNPTVPDPFWQGPLLDTTRAVKKGDRIPQPAYDQYVSPTVINRILNIADFGTFGGQPNARGQLEGTPHNFIHRWVGGDMATAGSPTDPIFWMHHCNCDRLYSTWIAKHPGRLPKESDWLDRQFIDFCDKGLKVSQTSDSTVPPLSYTYDRLGTGAFMAARALPPLAFVEGPPVKPEVAGKAEVCRLPIKEQVAAAVRPIIAGAVDRRSSTIRLELSGIKVPANQDVGVSVFLNHPNPRPGLPASDAHYVGSFTFFDGAHGEEGGHGGTHGQGVTVALDATDALIALHGDTVVGEEESFRVQIVAAPLFPDRKGPKWEGTVEELSPAQVRLVVATPKE